MKTFTNLVEDKMAALFVQFKEHPELVSFITNGFPMAISAYLSNEMYDSNKTETELVLEGLTGKLMKFALKAVKKGDSLAFIPEFTLLESGKELIDSDEIEFDYDTMEKYARLILKNDKFVKTLNKAFYGMIYSNGEWTEPEAVPEDKKGLYFEEETDVALCAYASILSIIEVLCNNKDASAEITYEVPGLGTFKVAPVKDGYSVTLTFDKEFKSSCKSDKLAEKLVDVVE